MSDATITRGQLRTVYIATELGGKPGESDHFSYAGLGSSSYSFGQMQFDVDHSPDARAFLKENGFDATDIDDLRQHGGLSRDKLNALDAKLQTIPQEKLQQFTNGQLDKKIAEVGNVIDQVRAQNPANAEAIARDQKLQLGLSDYSNQFGSITPQLVSILKGNAETLHSSGITVKAGNPPTREDIQTFIGATKYGHDPANARGVAGREAHFNEAMGELGLGPVVKAHGHTSDQIGSLLKEGAHGDSVRDLQSNLAALGYTDSHGHALQADGYYGRDTAMAVESYQRNNGLPADGVAGPKTLSAIHAQSQALGSGTPAFAAELPGYDPAHRTPLNREPPMPVLPEASVPPQSSLDPRHPDSPNHALYNKIQQRLPDASEQRLLQFTAVCHSMGITGQNLTDITFDQKNGIVNFAGNDNFAAKTASVDVKVPGPPADQSIQHIQQTDQFQAQLQIKINATIAQNNLQGPQGPTPGGGR